MNEFPPHHHTHLTQPEQQQITHHCRREGEGEGGRGRERGSEREGGREEKGEGGRGRGDGEGVREGMEKEEEGGGRATYIYESVNSRPKATTIC